MLNFLWQKLQSLASGGEDAVVITIIGARGSIPGAVGAKALISTTGLEAGTIGGGKIEARALFLAQELLADASQSACQTRCWNLQHDIGMTCGGEMTLLFEVHRARAPWRVVIFGAGHVTQALVPVLGTLPCSLLVVDTRADWLEKLPVMGNLHGLHVPAFEDGVAHVRADDFVLSMTQGHATDFPVLRELFKVRPPLPFIGVIGSRVKRAVLLRDLRAEAIPEELLRDLVCPLGLPIGGNAPVEIAISIAAQLLQVRDAIPVYLGNHHLEARKSK